jgi:transcriptional regulator GlxA family with amidase domain
MRDAASHVGTGASNFCRVFRRETGIRFMDFAAHYRIKRARELLQTTEVSIKEVAVRSGFGSIAQFNRQFKRFSGTSATEYRREFKRGTIQALPCPLCGNSCQESASLVDSELTQETANED